MPAKPTYEDLEKRVRELESAEAKSKRMFDEMQQEKNRYQNLFKHMLHEVHVWELVFDDHGNIKTWKLVDANPAALTSWNKTLPEVIGKTPDEMFPDSNATEQFLPIVEKIYREGIPHRWESYFPDSGQFLHMISVSFGDYFISTGFDITESKQAEETLRQKHEMLKRTEAIAHVGSWEWEIATDTVTWSEELYRIFQLDPGDEAPNWAEHSKLYHPEDLKKLRQAAETAIADGKPYEIELRAFRKDGETRICTAKGFPETGESGQVVRLFGLLQDITDRKLAEDALKKQNYYLEKAQALGQIGTWEFDLIKNTLFWTDQNCKIFGVPEGSVVDYETFINKVHPDDRESVDKEWKAAVEGKPYDIEHRLLIDGEVKWVREKAEIKYDDKGKAVSAIGFTQDITDRKLLEESLAVERKRLSMLLEAFPGFIYLQAPDYSVPFANQYFMDHFGDPQNRPCYNVLWNRETPCDSCYTFNVFDTKTPQVWEWSKAPDGKIYMIHDSPFIDVDDTELVLEIGLDITDRRKAEDELRKSERELQRTLDAAADGIWSWHFKTEKMSFSSRYYQMLGYKPDAFPSSYENWIKLIHPDDREKALAVAEEYLQTKPDLYENEFRLKTSSGGYRWINAKGRVVEKDENGDAVYMIGNHQDITDRKQIEQLLKESEERFRLAMEFANDGLFDWDLETDEIYYSPVWKRLLGYEDNEIPNDFSVWETLTHPQDVERSWKMQQEFINRQRDRFEIEFKMKHKDGHWVDILARANAIFDDMGKAVRIIGTHVDITERKQTELALKESEERFKALHNASFGGIAIHDKGIILECNKGMSDLTGYGYNELIGMKGLSLISDDTRDHVIANINCGYEKPYEAKGVRKNGEKYPLRLEARNIPYKGKEVRVVEFRDITDQKKAEAALRESEAKYRLMAENMSDVISIMDMNLRFTYISPSIKRLTGFSVEEFIDHSVEEIMSPEYFKKVMKAFEDEMMLEASGTADPSRTRRIEFEQYKQDLSTIWVEASCSFLRDTDKRPTKILVISRDINERKRAEAERERLMAAIEQTGEAIVVTDTKGVIQYVNPAFEEITGYMQAEAIGQKPGILKSGRQDGIFYKQLWENISSGRIWAGRMVNKKKDGSFYTEDTTISPVFDASGRIINYVAVKRDITEHLKLSDQLQQAQKMESVGRLAGGVAHDYNNTLAVIIGFTEMAINDVDPANPMHDNLNEVLKAANHATDITRQLLAFARKQTIAPKVLDLNDAVEGMLNMLRRLIGEDIDLTWSPGAALWSVKMDPSQIDQILANLCVNARDAIDGVGKITIETQNLSFDEDYCANHPGFVPGDFVLLAISDNGCGMDKETLDNIFEPFFTTKDVDKGTGLGMSTVYGIAKQNNGFVNIYSEPGKGTTIRVCLPRHEGKAVGIRDEITAEIPRGRGETILVAEDDRPILKLAEKILAWLGYTVLIANTTEAAMELAAEHTGEIDLLITDVIMPEMNGRDLAHQLQSLSPDLKRIFMSGYTANVIAHHGVLDDDVHFIQKPFSRRDLATIVRKVLDE